MTDEHDGITACCQCYHWKNGSRYGDGCTIFPNRDVYAASQPCEKAQKRLTFSEKLAKAQSDGRREMAKGAANDLREAIGMSAEDIPEKSKELIEAIWDQESREEIQAMFGSVLDILRRLATEGKEGEKE